MADRLQTALEARPEGGVRLVPYLMAGFPTPEASIALGRGFAEAGAAAIEVGVPFSDPLADGPVIQKAGHGALVGGMTVRRSIEVAGAIAEAGVPVVLMPYLNPVLSYGVEEFARDAAAAGVAGMIFPDLPVDEAEPFLEPFRARDLDTVFLAAPTSTDARIDEIARLSRGFIYCVSVTGVTGARRALSDEAFSLLARIKARTRLPVAIGFGISQPTHIERLRGHVEAAAVGSALVREVLEGRDPVPLLRTLVQAGSA
ncbi:MAG: tryptophan synthase subunit alpha [Candidatus Dormibacteraeota bacterium]|nr:tryptophan synthase subunit alpha [Candidatus Dormibacteraeota bacterium]